MASRNRRSAEATATSTEAAQADTSLPLIPESSPEFLDSSTSFDPTVYDRPTADLPHDKDSARAQYPDTRVAVTASEPVRRKDPWDRNAVLFQDGYKIQIQESDSRNTIEVQFGDGSLESRPKAFDAIKAILKPEGYQWNGTNAWDRELTPVLGSQNDRLRGAEENRQARARLEDVVFPKVIAAEEAVRGPIDLSDTTRERINRAVAPQGR